MFGYIKPKTSELKIWEFEQFRTAYCTLCHTLKEEYGANSRFILNYDFVFLTMLLWPEDVKLSCCQKSCIVSPVKKKNVFTERPEAIKIAAGFSIILAYWKLCDNIADEKFSEALKARAGKLFLKRSYKKAAARYPEFDSVVSELLCELSDLEKANSQSIDITADKFALILKNMAEYVPEKNKRIISEILYHTGRWIYIVDAYNDLRDDIENKKYNPISTKYSLNTYSDFSDQYRAEIECTLQNSIGRVAAAFELLDDNHWSPIIRNIIYLGMDNVFQLVKLGKYDSKDKNNHLNGANI